MANQIFGAGSTGPEHTRFVSGYNSSASSIAAGSAVCWDITNDDDIKGFVLPSNSNAGALAGIIEETVGAGLNTDLIRRAGIAQSALVDGSGVAVVLGDSLKTANASPKLVKDAGAAHSSSVQAFTAMDATTSDSTLQVYVQLP